MLGNKIQSIKLEDDNLIITYQSGTTETKSVGKTGNKTKSQMKCKCGFKKDLGKDAKMLWTCPKCGAEAGARFDIYEVPAEDEISLLKEVKDYLKSLPSKSISLKELEQQIGDDNKPTNWKPLIIGGSIVGGLLVIGLITYFLLKDKKRK